MSMGEDQGWENVIWRCDAKRLVDIIRVYEDPWVWEILHQVLDMKAFLKCHNWKVEWFPRETNRLEDRAAKYAFGCKANLSFRDIITKSS